MADLYEEYGLEMEADPSLTDLSPKESKEPVIKKSGGWIRSILALVLGIVIGVGAVAGGGYFAVTFPARTAIETIGGFAGLDYEKQIQNKFLAEEYEEKPLLEIGKELAKVIKDKNLVGINNIVPAIGDYIDKLVGNMNTEFGVMMDSNAIIETPFHELPAYLGETFRTTPLGNMLKATSKTDKLEPILMEICYGEEGVHYHLDENGEVVMNEGHQAATFETLGTTPNAMLNKISLAAVLPPNPDDTLMMSMAYGREDVTYTVEKNSDGTAKVDEDGHAIVTMLPLYFKKDGDVFLDYNNDPVACDITALENGFVQMDKHPTYDGAAMETYYLKEGTDGKYYAYKEAKDDAAQATFKKTMIGDLSADSSSMINNIYIKDALNVKYDPLHPENDPHAILFSLAYGTEGADYKVDPTTKEITMIGDAQPRTIGDLRERGTDIINDVAISDIMDAENDDALGMYLLYGKKGIHYDFDGDGNMYMLHRYIAISDDNTKVYNEYGEQLQMKDGETNGCELDLVNSIFTDIYGVQYTYQAATPEKTIKTPHGQMKVYYLYQDGSEVLFTKHSLGELAGGDNLIYRLTDRLTLTEVLHDSNLSENKFLKHVDDCTVSEIPERLEALAFTDMFSDEIFGAGAIKYEGTTPLTDELGNTITAGEYYKITDGKIYKSELKGTWWYLLHDSDTTDGTMNPSDYLIALHMNDLLNNMTTNVHEATLYKLDSDGIISGLGDLVNKDIIRIDGAPIAGVPDTATKLGHLTVTEMLHYTTFVMDLIP